MALSSALTAFTAFLIPVGRGVCGTKGRSSAEQVRRAKQRQDYERLLTFNDQRLSDMGITRVDVEAALVLLDRR